MFTLPAEDDADSECKEAAELAMSEYFFNVGNFEAAFNSCCYSAQDIMSSMTEENVHIFDNIDFLEWIKVTPYDGDTTVPNGASDPVPTEILSLFSASEGACPFVTVEDLKDATLALYNWRSDFETIPAFTVDASTCTQET